MAIVFAIDVRFGWLHGGILAGALTAPCLVTAMLLLPVARMGSARAGRRWFAGSVLLLAAYGLVVAAVLALGLERGVRDVALATAELVDVVVGVIAMVFAYRSVLLRARHVAGDR